MWHMGVIGSLVVVILGIVAGWLLNCHNVPNEEPETLRSAACRWSSRRLRRRNDVVVVEAGALLAGGGLRSVGGRFWSVNGAGSVTTACSQIIRKVQNGYVRQLRPYDGRRRGGLVVVLPDGLSAE